MTSESLGQTTQQLMLQLVQSLQGNVSVDSPVTGASRTSEEFRSLFRPLPTSSRNRRGNQSRSRELVVNQSATPSRVRTWTGKFCALSSKESFEAPSQAELITLAHNELGLKDVTLMLDDDAQLVNEKLLSAFKPLATCGGLEILVSKSGKRNILVSVSIGPIPVTRLKNLTTGRIYLRPLQKSVSLLDIDDPSCGLQQECLVCHTVMPIQNIPGHLHSHHRTFNEDNDITNDMSTSALETWSHDSISAIQSSSTTQFSQTQLSLPFVGSRTSTSVSVTSNVVSELPNAANDRGSSTSSVVTSGTTLSLQQTPIPDQTSPHTTVPTVKECIAAAVAYQSSDPVAILRHYQNKVMYGRPIDLTSGDSTIDGDTTQIYVDRFRILQTTFKELVQLADDKHDFRTPLEVTFYDELAVDLGGPRRELLTTCVREMLKDEAGLFIETANDNGHVITARQWQLENRFYFAAGLLCGISILQGGPLPTFLSDGQLNVIVNDLPTTAHEQQFKDGLNVLGIAELMKQKPTLLYLLRPTAQQPLTLRKLMLLLRPQFSAVGSISRQNEDLSYSIFIDYVREVASGRRQPVSLGGILKFATGTDMEPLFGFSIPPSIVFDSDITLPHANTCIHQLRLPIMHRGVNLNLLDLAFVNDFFGKA